MYSRVYVEITNICNMHCSFCHGHSRAPGQMTEEQYARVLEQLAGKTQYIYHHLMGEPLVHPSLPRFIRMACEAGFKPMLTSLKKSTILMIMISLSVRQLFQIMSKIKLLWVYRY